MIKIKWLAISTIALVFSLLSSFSVAAPQAGNCPNCQTQTSPDTLSDHNLDLDTDNFDNSLDLSQDQSEANQKNDTAEMDDTLSHSADGDIGYNDNGDED
jgi:hypothetical protein